MEADPSDMLAAFAAVQRGTLELAGHLERLSGMFSSNLTSATAKAEAGLSRVVQPSNAAARAIANVGEGVGRTSERFRQLAQPAERVAPALTRIAPAARTASTAVDTLTRSTNSGRDALGRFVGAGKQAGDEVTALASKVDKAGGAFGRFVVRVNEAQKALSEGFTPAQKAAKEIADRFMATGLKLTLGVTLPIAFAAGSVVKAAAEMDSLKRGLIAVAGSAEEAERQLARLQDVAKLPGLGFQEAIRGSVSLQAAGFSAKGAERSLMAFGNALATVGKGKADLDGVTLALTQIASKGKISAEEINQLSERVPQVRKAMQAAFGTADTEKLQKSGLSATAFVEGLTEQLLKLPAVTGGVGNAFENMNDALFRTRAAIGEQLLPAVIPLVNGLANLLSQVREVNPYTLRTAISFAAVAAAAGPLVLFIGGVISAVSTLATALSIGLLPLLLASGPIVIGLGIIAASFVMVGMEALAAAADAEAAASKFRSSLLSMDDAVLQSSLMAKSRATDALIRTRNALADDLKLLGAPQEAPKPGPLRRYARAATALDRALGVPTINVPLEDPLIDSKRQQLATVEGMINDRARELGEITNELHARQARALEPRTPVLDLTGGADKMAAQRRALQDLTADMKALFMFSGATFKNDLPQNIQQQLTLVDSLTDRITQAGAALGKMGAAAPDGAVQAFARLNLQLQIANRELQEMAAQWNGLASRAPNMGAVPVNNMTGMFNPNANRALNPSGGNAARGSMFGDGFGENLGLVSTALLTLRESALQAGRVLVRAVEQAASAGGQFASNISSYAAEAVKGGAGLATALSKAVPFAAVMEVTTGFFQALQPALDALTLPLRMLGEILSLLMIPVLRLLFPVFKVVAVVASYLGEILAKVAGAIATAIGSLVRGIGRLVNKLPGSPGDPLVKAGQAMIDLGNGFKDAAKEMAEKRKELQGMSFEDALKKTSEAADKLTESLINAVDGFKIEPYRFAALPSAPRTVPEVSQSRAAQTVAPVQQSVSIAPTIVFNGSEDNTFQDMYRKWYYGLRDLARGNPALNVQLASYPEPR